MDPTLNSSAVDIIDHKRDDHEMQTVMVDDDLNNNGDNESGSEEASSQCSTQTLTGDAESDPDSKNDESISSDDDCSESSDDDTTSSDDNDEQSDGEQQTLTEITIMQELPKFKTPRKMLMAVRLKDDGLAYLVEWENEDGSLEPGLIESSVFKHEHPDIVIACYQENLHFKSKLDEGQVFSESDDWSPDVAEEADDEMESESQASSPNPPEETEKLEHEG